MNKLHLLFALIVFISPCHSQTRFAIFAGSQTTPAKYSMADVKQPTDHKFGFQAGFGWKVPFENHLFFSPAGFYSLKGYKVKFNQKGYPPDTTAIDNNTTIHTFETAFLLEFELGHQPSHVFIKAGPSLDFQLTGRERFNLKGGGSVDRNMPFGFTAYGHYSANLLMQVGVETADGFSVFGQYSLGLASISNADEGSNIRHRVYGISVGKYFRKPKAK